MRHILEKVVSMQHSFEEFLEEQDKSSEIEQQPPFGDRKISNIQPQNRGGGQNQQEQNKKELNWSLLDFLKLRQCWLKV